MESGTGEKSHAASRGRPRFYERQRLFIVKLEIMHYNYENVYQLQDNYILLNRNRFGSRPSS